MVENIPRLYATFESDIITLFLILRLLQLTPPNADVMQLAASVLFACLFVGEEDYAISLQAVFTIPKS